jgi:hypothetical protein
MKNIRNLKLTTCTLLLSACLVSSAIAKVSEEEAARLGADLTPFGAEMAGNAEGTIPAWTGGLAYTPEHVKGVRHTDPFAGDKVLYSVTAANMSQYLDHLSAGQKAMLEKYPDSYRLDIYPTRRSHSAPQKIYDNTRVNATRAELADGGNNVTGAFGGIPFPIPSNGSEAIWNHHFRWQGQGVDFTYNAYVVNNDGKFSKVAGGEVYERYPHYIGDSIEDFNGEVWNIFVNYQRPARRKGEVLVVRDPINSAEQPRKAWQYLVGQRRVRRAPTVAYDTPNAGFSGLATYDDAFLFNGALDKYEWKLIGKKELYLPYNSYKGDVYLEDPKQLYTPKHLNPDYVRWELHRVWVVEANLMEGKRHIYPKRTFYLDEDSWVVTLTDSYDGRGNIWRTSLGQLKNMTELPATVQRLQIHYDMNKGQYAVNNCQTEEKKISIYGQPQKNNFFSPEQIRRMGRR